MLNSLIRSVVKIALTLFVLAIFVQSFHWVYGLSDQGSGFDQATFESTTLDRHKEMTG